MASRRPTPRHHTEAPDPGGRGRGRAAQQQQPGRGGRRTRAASPPPQPMATPTRAGHGQHAQHYSVADASSITPLAPELRQATHTPQAQAQAQAHGQAPPQPVEVDATHHIPSSSKSIRFPLRPGKGTIGTRCMVKANHFFAHLPNKDLHHYDVSITPQVTSRLVNRAVIKELVNLYKTSYLGGRLPSYDGRKSLYTAGPLPFTSHEFQITLLDDDDASGSERPQRTFRVVIKFAARADLHRLELFLAGRHAEAPQEALQVLDIVLRELPSARHLQDMRHLDVPSFRLTWAGGNPLVRDWKAGVDFIRAFGLLRWAYH